MRIAASLNNSLSFDWRLAEVDVQASTAWAAALQRAGMLTDQETRQIITGLEQILDEIRSGAFKHVESDEDVHTAVERRLTELVGPVGASCIRAAAATTRLQQTSGCGR
jgi:argininosuccinate lyase